MSLLDISSLPRLNGEISVKASDWLKGDPRASFESWKAESQNRTKSLEGLSAKDVHHYRLMEKYGRIWREKTKSGWLLVCVLQ